MCKSTPCPAGPATCAHFGVPRPDDPDDAKRKMCQCINPPKKEVGDGQGNTEGDGVGNTEGNTEGNAVGEGNGVVGDGVGDGKEAEFPQSPSNQTAV